MTDKASRVHIDTPRGVFTVEVDLEAAPLTAAHFLKFAREGHLAHSAIYRIVTAANCEREPKIEVIQFGWYPRSPNDKPPMSPVAHEPTGHTGLRHRDGTISLARLEPGSGTSAFFVCLGDQPQLDQGGARSTDALGFAVFGRVVAGRATLTGLAELATATEWLTSPIPISGRLVGHDEADT